MKEIILDFRDIDEDTEALDDHPSVYHLLSLPWEFKGKIVRVQVTQYRGGIR